MLAISTGETLFWLGLLGAFIAFIAYGEGKANR